MSVGAPAYAGGAADQAVAYGINVAHTGSLAGDGLAPPLVKRWSTNLGGPISYPLIAGGKIFVTVGTTTTVNGQPSNAVTLDALNESDGSVAWSAMVPSTYKWGAAAYDSGTVFLLTYNGLLAAYAAGNGTQVWQTALPGQTAFSSAPTAANGTVYVGGAGVGGTLYAVDETTGSVRWTAGVMNGDESSPAVGPDGVYVSYACAQTYKFDFSGNLLWHFSKGCSGGGGKTPVLNGSSLYVRDFNCSSGCVLDAGTGVQTGSFSAGPAPAFSGATSLMLNGGTLTATDASGGTLWTVAGDGGLDTAPIVVNSTVYEGSSTGNLYGLDLATGRQVWTASAGAGIAGPDEQNVSGPLTGLGAGEGLLAVPAGTTLVVYGTAPPAVSGMAVSATEGAQFSGAVATLSDNSPFATGDAVSITWGDGTSSAGSVTSNPAGGYLVTGTHAYAEEGSFTVTVRVSNGNGSASATGMATVRDAPLTSTGYSLTAVVRTSSTLRVATVSDADPGCAAGDYTATITWGDGATSAGKLSAGSGTCAFNVSASHTYTATGTFAVSVRVTDAGGSGTTAGSTVTVNKHK